jgi:hypothetical protein
MIYAGNILPTVSREALDGPARGKRSGEHVTAAEGPHGIGQEGRYAHGALHPEQRRAARTILCKINRLAPPDVNRRCSKVSYVAPLSEDIDLK